jgi:CysZ protein
MISLFIKSFQTLKQPYFLRYVILAALFTIIGFSCLMGGVTFALKLTHLVKMVWLDKIIDVVLGAGTVWLSWFLFPLMMPLIAVFLGDALAAKIDEQDYDVKDTPSMPLMPQIVGALRFMVASIGWNILALVLLIFPPFWLVGYYLINGWLLGRDFFETVAVRHALPEEAERLRKNNRLKILLVGAGLVLLSNIPVMNLTVPFIAVAVMVHLFWSVRAPIKQSVETP